MIRQNRRLLTMSSFYVDERSIGRIAVFAVGRGYDSHCHPALKNIFTYGQDTWRNSSALFADAMLQAICDSLVMQGRGCNPHSREAARFLPDIIQENRLNQGFLDAASKPVNLTEIYKHIQCFLYQVDYPETCPKLIAHLTTLVEALPRIIVENSEEWNRLPWE